MGRWPHAGDAPAQPNVSQRSRPTVTKPHLVAHPQPVPILVYHHVLPSRKGPRLLYVGPAQFARELAYLKSRHYQAVTLRQVYDAWFGKGSLPGTRSSSASTMATRIR